MFDETGKFLRTIPPVETTPPDEDAISESQSTEGPLPGEPDTSETTVFRRCAMNPQTGKTQCSGVKHVYITLPDGTKQLVSSFTFTNDALTYHQRLNYTYYEDGDEFGSDGDLKTATLQVMRGGEWVTKETSYYRYYTAGQANGFEHALKYSVGPHAYERLKNDPAVSDPFIAPNSVVAKYADNYFEYSGQQVSKSVTNAGKYTYTYTRSTSAFTDGYNSWSHKTVTTRPDGAQEILYTNYLHQPMVRVLKDGSDEWVNYYQYDGQGRQVQHAHPSAVASYNEGSADMGVTLNASAGRIDITDYYLTTTATESTPGGVAGLVQFQKTKEGSGGSEIKLSETDYFKREAGGQTTYTVASSSVFRNDDGSGKITTSYSYTYFAGSTSVETKTTTLPVISAVQNGSGTANERDEIYTVNGAMTWQKDERGFITFMAYDSLTGAVTQTIRDVDMSLMDGYPQKPSWTTPAGGGLQLITDYESDYLGRTTQTLGPWHNVEGQDVRTASWNVYNDLTDEVLSGQGYANGLESELSYTLVNPVGIAQVSSDGSVSRNISAVRCEGQGRLSLADCFPQSTWVRWSEAFTDRHGEQTASRTYYDIPESGSGELNVNYNESYVGYDEMGRQNRQVSPGGTITRTVFDVRGNTIKTYVGTDDTGATDSDPTGGGATGNNMVIVSANQYDSGNDGEDNFLTQATQYVNSNAADNRVTSYTYDFRGRQLTVAGEENYFLKNTYDNLGQVAQVDRYNGSEAAANLIGRIKSYFDDLGRIYKTERYAVAVGTGIVGNNLYSLVWYDAGSNIIKLVDQGAKDGKAFVKMAFDGVGRITARYVGYFTGTGQETYADASSIGSTSKIFQQTFTTFDDAGNITENATYQRFHTATGGGSLNLPTEADPKARVSYMAYYHDGVGRQTSAANFGTNDNVFFTRSETTPDPSDDVLVTLTAYNDRGEGYLTTDPAGMVTRSDFNDAGRRVRTIRNYVAVEYEIPDCESTSCSCPSTTDVCVQPGNEENVMVETAYNADGQVSQLIAKNPTTGDQVTQYVYGTTLDDSDIARNDLLVAEVYPDSVDSADRVTYTYDRTGALVSMADQNGSVHEYDYDGRGRRTADRVTTLANGVDNSLLRIEMAYEARGQVESVTSFDAAASGSVVNEVEYAYNDFGQLITEYQAHDGAVDIGLTPKVEYEYHDGSVNTIRFDKLRYPNGDNADYDYDDAVGEDSEMLSRVARIKANYQVVYGYFGLSSIYRVNYPGADVDLDYANGTGSNPYASLDRFGRVIDMQWENYYTSTPLDHIQYGYDRASNRIWRKNLVAPAGLDDLYFYDGLHRLQSAERGQLSSGKSRIESNFEFHQAWDLDATGNWSGFEQFDQNSDTNALVQHRTHNEENEITDISETVGSEWATPSHDRNGNMIGLPQPAMPTGSYHAIYDAWNRLIKLTDSSSGDVVSIYYYDGVNRRIKTDEYDAGVYQQTRHLYFNNQWQNLEERIDSSTDAERQYVWGIQYIDELHIRRRDTDADGALDETLFVVRDGHWNTVSICDTMGLVRERYLYESYGETRFCDSAFSAISTSSVGWNYCYTCRKLEDRSRLYDFRFRNYSTLLGTFLSKDPVQLSVNAYSFVNSNPIVRVDPLGLFEEFTSALEAAQWVAGLFFNDKPTPVSDVQVPQIGGAKPELVNLWDPERSKFRPVELSSEIPSVSISIQGSCCNPVTATYVPEITELTAVPPGSFMPGRPNPEATYKIDFELGAHDEIAIGVDAPINIAQTQQGGNSAAFFYLNLIVYEKVRQNQIADYVAGALSGRACQRRYKKIRLEFDGKSEVVDLDANDWKISRGIVGGRDCKSEKMTPANDVIKDYLYRIAPSCDKNNPPPRMWLDGPFGNLEVF